MPRKARPSLTRGSGACRRRRQALRAAPLNLTRPSRCARPRAASPVAPESQISSPARAASRRSASPAGTSPITVIDIASGPRVVSPPTSSVPNRRASLEKPLANAAIHVPSALCSAIASSAQRGSAPMAARSDKLTASALWPRDSGSASGKKCRPASSMSVDTARVRPARALRSAQSSPTPSSAVRAGRVKYFRMISNSVTCLRTRALVRAQLGDELVEHAVYVLVPVRSAEFLCELDRLVDHDLVGNVGGGLQLERGEEQDAALYGRELLRLAVERRRDEALERSGVLDRALEEAGEVFGIGLAELLRLGELGLQPGGAF